MTVVPVGSCSAGRRATAGWVLVAAWLLAVGASLIGQPAHPVASNLLTAFLLWRIWRGATWSRHVLIALSCVSAGFAAGLALAIAAGATGIVTSALLMLVMYAGVGVLLSLPTVRGLARPVTSRSA
jgi:ABC-type nitrate/sulfonate/bicarbonate transport system permease component